MIISWSLPIWNLNLLRFKGKQFYIQSHINDNININTNNVFDSVEQQWVFWLIEFNFLEYSSSINLFKTCLSSGFTDKYWKLLTQIEFPGPLRSRTYIRLDWGYVFNWHSLPEVCTYIMYPHNNSSIFCVGWNEIARGTVYSQILFIMMEAAALILCSVVARTHDWQQLASTCNAFLYD